MNIDKLEDGRSVGDFKSRWQWPSRAACGGHHGPWWLSPADVSNGSFFS